jgi:hypothetical protein
MTPALRVWLGTMAVAAVLPVTADAHFTLMEPPSWLMENRLGDPQKAGPCGGTSADAGTPTNVVTAVTGGSKTHVKVTETVFHPGHYRIALAVRSRAELPADPDVVTRDTEKGAWSVSAAIQKPERPPVIVDGLWAHTERPAAPFEADIELPNINCEKCTLQIIQFMAEHGRNRDGDFSYHHCADLKITADRSKPLDARWPAVAGK